MASNIEQHALNNRYSVWAFMLSRVSGPQRMTVNAEDGQNVGILAEEIVFPPNASLHRFQVVANGRMYCVYFDTKHHKNDHENATYIFLHLLNNSKVLNICAEDDMPYLLEVWLRYISFITFYAVHCHAVYPRLHQCFPSNASMEMPMEHAINSATLPLAAGRKKDITLTTKWPPRKLTKHFEELKNSILARFPPELLHEVFGYCNVQDLVHLGCTSRNHGALVAGYLRLRMDLIIGPFVPNVEAFWQILRSCDAVVSGSLALYTLLPLKTTSWAPHDLDIYVAFDHFHYLKLQLTGQGYHLLHEGNANLNPDSFSLICNVVTFGNGSRQIDVIVSRTKSIGPIFQFHSTMVINFFRANHIFCAYPALTLRHLARINGGPLYLNRFQPRTIATLWKYAQCNFRYITCKSAHFSKYTCKSITRHLTNARSLWIDLNCLPHTLSTPVELFERYGYCFNPSRHAFYTLLTLFHRKLPPLQHYITIKGHFVIITDKGSVFLS